MMIENYQLINALLFGNADETYSSRCHREKRLTAQRDALLEILKAVQDGQEMTPEFCWHIDAVIELIETTKLNQQEIAK